MGKKSPAEKLEQKRTQWLERTSEAFEIGSEEALSLLNTPLRQSVRINTLLADQEDTLKQMKIHGWHGSQYAWIGGGYSAESGVGVLRDSDIVSKGEVYIQNASSWLAVLALDPKPNEKILDLCAAPGGKTTHIAAITSNESHITANDNSKQRLLRLKANCNRLGANIENFVLFDATKISRKLEGEQFDKILLDAPCSGEGMMCYDVDKDFATWSVAHIKRMQSLQKQIIKQAWQLLRPGGTLVYSTCTMAPEENEAVIDYALRKLEGVVIEPINIDIEGRVDTVKGWQGKDFDVATKKCMRLKPTKNLEAFFVAKLRKDPEAEVDQYRAIKLK